MNKLFARQLAKATDTAGEVDLAALGELVASAYDQADRDRRRTDRSISLMVEELDQLTRHLEKLVIERTATLRERESQLQAALNNMAQALIMFDADGRLVLANPRYAQMYGLPPDAVKPGMKGQELLEMRRQRGVFSGDPKEYFDNVMDMMRKGQTLNRFIELPDGRTVAVVSQPMPGGGSVVTHEDITERRLAEKKIAHMARHDFLTDLPNRVLLREQLGQALAEVARNDGRLAVLYFDLDHFKTVNDTLGHHVGDELLKVVAGRLRGCLRESDTVARVGGDEFAIIQTGIETPQDTAALARRIGEALRAPFEVGGHSLMIGVTIGIAFAPDDGREPNDLLKNADTALYGAKAEGRGSYRFFEPAMDARMKARRALELDLRKALTNGEFDLHYQPLVNLADNRITSCEALLRWEHPERGMVSPVEFIPVAEDAGLIVPLGEWVIRKACADAARWPDDMKVAVNLSSIQVMNPNLISVVIGALAASGLPGRRLAMEITESVLMHNTEASVATLHRLRELGVSISLDDFGTGYSSLRYLHSFPFDKIKIDRCFISDLPNSNDSAAIVRAVTGLAENLNLITTAEGVETEEQLAHVRALGCTEMQGYLFSAPRRAAELDALFPREMKRATG